jgi:hypothetical protein
MMLGDQDYRGSLLFAAVDFTQLFEKVSRAPCNWTFFRALCNNGSATSWSRVFCKLTV